MNDRKTIDADKALLHMTFAGRRLLIAHVITCIAFIIAIVFFTTQNTQREQQIIDLIANGVRGIHVYTMNKPDIAESIKRNLSAIIG